MAKIDTAKAIVKAVQSLSTEADSASDLEAEFFDTGAYTDEGVSSIGIAADSLSACITLLQQVAALMSGNATTPSIYRVTLNKVRRAQV